MKHLFVALVILVPGALFCQSDNTTEQRSRIEGVYKQKDREVSVRLHSDTLGSWCTKGFICSGFKLVIEDENIYIQHFTELGELAQKVELKGAKGSVLILKYPDERKPSRYKRIR